MLRASVIDFKGSWDDHLPLIEFAYNNSYHSSIQMAFYEALYGRRCRSPVGWFEVGEVALIGPDLVLYAMDKTKDNPKSSEILCKCEEKGIKVQSGWLGFPESVTYERGDDHVQEKEAQS